MIAASLRNAARKQSLQCQIGGEEFLVVSTYPNAQDGFQYAKGLRQDGQLRQHDRRVSRVWISQRSEGALNENCVSRPSIWPSMAAALEIDSRYKMKFLTNKEIWSLFRNGSLCSLGDGHGKGEGLEVAVKLTIEQINHKLSFVRAC